VLAHDLVVPIQLESVIVLHDSFCIGIERCLESDLNYVS
jgi:hypothetical protein